MELNVFLRGLLIGLSVAATVGPMSVLCIQRTLQRGFRYGFVSGVGVATADGVYGSIAGFGLTVISSFLVAQQGWIRVVGGVFLVYLGVRTLLTKPAEKAAQATQATGYVSAYASTFLLTMTNPMTILSFVAIFAGVGVGSGGSDIGSALLVVGGVFLGSVLWWLVLTGGVNWLRDTFTATWMLWINRVSGCVIVVFGVVGLVSQVVLT